MVLAASVGRNIVEAAAACHPASAEGQPYARARRLEWSSPPIVAGSAACPLLGRAWRWTAWGWAGPVRPRDFPPTEARIQHHSVAGAQRFRLGRFDGFQQLLTLQQLGEPPAEGHQLVVRALFDDAPVVEHEDVIRLADGAGAV